MYHFLYRYIYITLSLHLKITQAVSVTVSVLTLTFISIDRWYAICFPLRYVSTNLRAILSIAFIWAVALLSGKCTTTTHLYMCVVVSLVAYKVIYFFLFIITPQIFPS